VSLQLVLDALAHGGPQGPNLSTALLGAGLCGVFALAGGLADSVAIYLNAALAHRIGDHVQELTLRQSLRLDLGYFETAEFHDRLYRAQQEGGSRPAKIAVEMSNVVRSSLAAVSLVALAASQAPWLLAVALVAAVANLSGRARLAHDALERARSLHRKEQSMALHDGLALHPSFAKEVRVWGLAEWLLEKHRTLAREILAERLVGDASRATAQARTLAIGAIGTGAVIGGLAYMVVLGRLTAGGLVVSIQAFTRFVTQGRQLLSSIANIYEDGLYLVSLDEFLALEPKIADPDRANAPATIKGALRFEGVSFTYPGSTERALSDVNLEIGAGEVVALVGENGAGKSTVAKLICRLYDPDEGRILLDGIDLRDYPVDHLRRAIAVVFQDHARFPLTVRENIQLGDVSRDEGSAIRDAAAWSGIEPAIERLPKGYEAELNKWIEGGQELSGGEWQRLALARARYRGGAILVMDEPTSALDAIVERELVGRMTSLAAERTALIISHRFSSVRFARRVLVMANGRIVEQGGHAELMRSAGPYARMFEAQAEAYRSQSDGVR